MKIHESIRGSGPLTISQPWEAVVFEGRDCLILTSPLTDIYKNEHISMYDPLTILLKRLG